MGVETLPRLHDCPCCICGLVALRWSDREKYVRPDDLLEIADTIVACALDHYYDRELDQLSGYLKGIDIDVDAWLPVVERYLEAARPDWREHTVNMNEAEYLAFRDAVLYALQRSGDP